jgi:hypothetical protein
VCSPLLVASNEHHTTASAREFQCYAFADPATRASNQCNFPVHDNIPLRNPPHT